MIIFSTLKNEHAQNVFIYSNRKFLFMKLSTIEKPVGSMEILVHLHKNEKATITEIVKNEGLNQRTTYSAIENLQNQKLINREITDEFPICKYYKLTGKGKEVAKRLEEIEEFL